MHIIMYPMCISYHIFISASFFVYTESIQLNITTAQTLQSPLPGSPSLLVHHPTWATTQTIRLIASQLSLSPTTRILRHEGQAYLGAVSRHARSTHTMEVSQTLYTWYTFVKSLVTFTVIFLFLFATNWWHL